MIDQQVFNDLRVLYKNQRANLNDYAPNLPPGVISAIIDTTDALFDLIKTVIEDNKQLRDEVKLLYSTMEDKK